MKKIIALSVLALALTGCAAKEEAAAPAPVVEEAAPAAEAPAAEAAPAEVGGVPQDVGAAEAPAVQ